MGLVSRSAPVSTPDGGSSFSLTPIAPNIGTKRETMVCISSTTPHRLGNILEQHHRLRYETFLNCRYWTGISTIHGMEYDVYDTPAAQYLLCVGRSNRVLGCARLSPTDRPYMLRDNWPEMCTVRALPQSLSVWEMTRLCVDQSLSRKLRSQVKNELVCALLEFGLAKDLQELVAVMHPRLWSSVFLSAGWNVAFMGDEQTVGDGLARAAAMTVDFQILKVVREKLGIARPVLRFL